MTIETGEGYDDSLARRAATLLVDARRSGLQCDALPEDVRPRTIQDGYRVQAAAREILSGSGFGRQGGWKIGCTTTVMQQYLDMDAPVSGTMFLRSMWHGAHQFEVTLPRILGVECEIAVRVGEDLQGTEEPYGAQDVAAHVSAVMASIEVVEDRYVDYRSLDNPTLVADDYFHHGCVLGTQHENIDARELGSSVASMTINGVVVGTGKGSDILGDPLVALAWLANHCATLQTPLLAGDVVSLGSLVQTQWVAPGDVVAIHNDMLGEVHASFDSRHLVA